MNDVFLSSFFDEVEKSGVLRRAYKWATRGDTGALPVSATNLMQRAYTTATAGQVRPAKAKVRKAIEKALYGAKGSR